MMPKRVPIPKQAQLRSPKHAAKRPAAPEPDPLDQREHAAETPAAPEVEPAEASLDLSETELPRRRPRAGEKRPPGGLHVAAQLLAAAGEPMRCSDLVKQMLEAGLWRTNGKTPVATIHAAITREIQARGDRSRFRKVGPGLFSAAPPT
jgi:hypothetical protein